MTTPSPDRGVVSVEPMTDIDPDRLDEIRSEFADYSPSIKLGRVHGTPTMGEFHALLSMASRALPSPRRYTGGPLEDGVYLFQRPTWDPVNWTSFGVAETVANPFAAPKLLDDEWVWLIGPIPIPPIPESEEPSNG